MPIKPCISGLFYFYAESAGSVAAGCLSPALDEGLMPAVKEPLILVAKPP